MKNVRALTIVLHCIFENTKKQQQQQQPATATQSKSVYVTCDISFIYK